ncbi:uncharacterized protein LOC121735328 [Aricia agestis]|uniref:uncharacterized protein LOC121735328 n=1 Tax=Aricia agestis TaxID=91739 RepID=UPI001C20676A|nr:uncharacterized protein LOC121735328 [Aricia agestis]
MKKFGKDPAVKKTLLRNYERPVTKYNLAVFESLPSSSKTNRTKEQLTQEKACDLDQPTLCSSETLANYLNYTKNSLPTQVLPDLETNKDELCTQVTKKLNFHFNDRIYKNLVELNTSVEKPKITKRPLKTKLTPKKDLEPNIEDFCDDQKFDDLLPDIQILKPKVTKVRPVENGDLHKLVAKFENL